MKINKKNGLANLTKKATSIFGAALAAITGIQSPIINQSSPEDQGSNTIQSKVIGKVKPMPILKLNFNNPENSKFVASHSSHSSHRSHSSHYSHRSAAMHS